MLRFRDGPEAATITGDLRDKVLHATFCVGNAQLMASDMGCDSQIPLPVVGNLALAVRVADAAAAERCFGALQEDGNVQVPLGETDFAIRYGIVQDKFGIAWKIIAQREPQTGQ